MASNKTETTLGKHVRKIQDDEVIGVLRERCRNLRNYESLFHIAIHYSSHKQLIEGR